MATTTEDPNIREQRAQRLHHMKVPADRVEYILDLWEQKCSVEFDEVTCAGIADYLQQAVPVFLKSQFPGVELSHQVWLTGCRPKKFSMHCIVPNLVFDRAAISCRYVAWEFARYLWKNM